MIHKVRIQNFKSLRDVSVDLERLPCSSGRTAAGRQAFWRRYTTRCGRPPATHKRCSPTSDTATGFTRGVGSAICPSFARRPAAVHVEATPPEGYPPPPELMQKERWEYRVSPSGANRPPHRPRTGPEDVVPAVECGRDGHTVLLAARSTTGGAQR